MTDARPLRSLLYMPASNARAMAKARSLDCDAVCLDLEDAVAPEAKAEARTALVAELQAGGFGHRRLIARINGLSTPWGHDDLPTCRHFRPGWTLSASRPMSNCG